MRAFVGADFPLAFDANNTYSIAGALRVGRVLEKLDYSASSQTKSPFCARTAPQIPKTPADRAAASNLFLCFSFIKMFLCVLLREKAQHHAQFSTLVARIEHSMSPCNCYLTRILKLC